MSSEFKQRPLKTMNTALQKAGRLLSKINPERGRCLDAVTRCQPLITWLRKTIAGVHVHINKCIDLEFSLV